MTYRIRGLDPSPFSSLFGSSEAHLAAAGVTRVAVTSKPGFPCRVSLDDAEVGEMMLLLNHASVLTGPYAAKHAIFVTEGADRPAEYRDTVPPALDRRILSLRAFDADEMMIDATLVQPGEADAALVRLFDQPEVAYVHAHNAIRGCFAALVERSR